MNSKQSQVSAFQSVDTGRLDSVSHWRSPSMYQHGTSTSDALTFD